MKFTNKEKAQEARRELGMRRHVYADRVNRGQMRRDVADRLIAIMEDIVADYEAQDAQDRPDLFAAQIAPQPFRVGDRVEWDGGRGVIRFWRTSELAEVECNDGSMEQVRHDKLRRPAAVIRCSICQRGDGSHDAGCPRA